MKFFLFFALSLTTIFSTKSVDPESVLVKLPSATILTHRLVCKTESEETPEEKRAVLYYFAEQTNLASKLAHKKLSAKEIINIIWLKAQKIKDPITQESAFIYLEDIISLIFLTSYEGYEAMLEIKSDLIKTHSIKKNY